MPVIKSAKKKLRQDIKRAKANSFTKTLLKEVFKKAKKSPTTKNVSEAFKVIDKNVKKRTIHANKASRLKSTLSKLAPKSTETKKKEVAKKTSSVTKKKATVKKTK